MSEQRIISLLPSATEILFALGLDAEVRAVTHECDYPAGALSKPHITRSLLAPNLSSGEIDAAVREQLAADAHSLYTIDRDLLAEIAPTLIVTQRLCEVCAVAYDEVLEAVRSLPERPQVINLEPERLDDVLGDIERVGAATDRVARAAALVAGLRRRVEAVRQRVAAARTRPRVAFIEWIDPIFCGGHWNPELIALAGGEDGIGRVGERSEQVAWERVAAYQPEVMVVAACGFTEERSRQDEPLLRAYPGFDDLPCAQAGRVHFVDGAAYFSRPGPRLVDSLELLAHLIHPDLFPGLTPERATPFAAMSGQSEA
ncbi:MAG TPA: cobalamin-binding protein [Ktedonobacterales bacterium]|jgi:iron complex transport system substrate-binding protein|nr:cobalamin-binding protein [Ktedonobacterales bacterium]